MALLTADMQERLVKLLVDEGLVEAASVEAARQAASGDKKSLFEELIGQKLIDEEMLTHGVAQVSGVPYVNLLATTVDKKYWTSCRMISLSALWPCRSLKSKTGLRWQCWMPTMSKR